MYIQYIHSDVITYVYRSMDSYLHLAEQIQRKQLNIRICKFVKHIKSVRLHQFQNSFNVGPNENYIDLQLQKLCCNILIAIVLVGSMN